ncbi:MAG: Nicotinamidase [Candidatus Carbobacillus altaicus]|uniref:Nicotinamidase n=1 Tax=Candidatus Carbonibacillus altaicus TaxID=2163959 RepID=A0A2R6Y5E8_9BACL|nr:MAG: Nicotinamidase [Candidatus Carbobacillus altaicus]
MSKKALLIVDYLNDFAHPDGALTAGQPAQAIDDVIVRAIDVFLERGDIVIFASDAHTEDDPEFQLWPKHAVRGTFGQAIYGKTGERAQALMSHPHVKMIEKTTYDAFYQTELEDFLREHAVTDLYLAGINTSICVMATTQGGYFRGFRMHVLEQATADLSAEAHAFALKHMANIYKAEIVRDEEAFARTPT